MPVNSSLNVVASCISLSTVKIFDVCRFGLCPKDPNFLNMCIGLHFVELLLLRNAVDGKLIDGTDPYLNLKHIINNLVYNISTCLNLSEIYEMKSWKVMLCYTISFTVGHCTDFFDTIITVNQKKAGIYTRLRSKIGNYYNNLFATILVQSVLTAYSCTDVKHSHHFNTPVYYYWTRLLTFFVNSNVILPNRLVLYFAITSLDFIHLRFSLHSSCSCFSIYGWKIRDLIHQSNATVIFARVVVHLV
ncbi:hypothetical protein AGLY_015729 [Aphis glycines]|uniref:Uncharacterized protein n=1 Tax=Aphis glycines TaxID=307491 RepID=A0A6G0T1P3_APHGL|nr:hypothetical protein AGLY_015729 [Aphis glycines]